METPDGRGAGPGRRWRRALGFGLALAAGALPAALSAPAAAGASRPLAVGSSVMLAARPALRHQLHAAVDAARGRDDGAILARLAADRDRGRLSPEVIVQLGEHGPTAASTIDALRRTLRGVPHVVLVNVRLPVRRWVPAVNAALARAVRSWPAAAVADWNAASRGPGRLVGRNGLPSAAGGQAYARLVARTLASGGLRTRRGGVQGTVISDSVGETIDEVPAAEAALTDGLRLNLELRVCRRLIYTSCPYQGQTPATALATVESLGGGLGPVLVIDVGYNDDAGGYGDGIDEIMHAALAQGAREVVWLTLHRFAEYTATYAAINAQIRAAEGRWPQLRVADWDAVSAGRPWFADGIHPNDAGAVALAQLIHDYIAGA